MTTDHSDAPEAINTSSAYKEAVPRPDGHPHPALWHHSPRPRHPAHTMPTGRDRTDSLVCGLRQRNFLILALATLVILGAAIGGGVGGGLAAR